MGRLPLRVGETSIDTVRPYEVTIKGKPYLRLGWSIRMPGEATSRTYYTTAMQGTNTDELRRRAHAKADALLRGVSDDVGACMNDWTSRSLMADYLSSVTSQVISDEPGLRPRSRVRYRQLLAIALEEAAGQSIESFCSPRVLVATLRHTATSHGTSTAMQLRRWMGKYVMRQLVMDGVIAFDPLRDLEVTLPSVCRGVSPGTSRLGLGQAEGAVPAGGAISAGSTASRHRAPSVAVLTPDERARVIGLLLEPDVLLAMPYRGPLTSEEAASFRTTIIDMTLVHATCGLRANECRSLRVGNVDLAGNVPVIEVTPEVSKTHRGRLVPLFDPAWGEAVGRRLAARVDTRRPEEPVFGAARDATKLIHPRCAASNTRRLYDRLADLLDIPLLRQVSTHVWRATLNTEWQARGMPPAMCSALFGHSAAVNRTYYTAEFDPELICRAARQARGRGSGT